jgi:hypothetical protein
VFSKAPNGTAYARERRFFLSSTPMSIQPECDKWCMMQDLCDKSRSGSVTTDHCFTQCVEDNGRRLLVAGAHSAALRSEAAVGDIEKVPLSPLYVYV